jgi:tRNA (guanine-N7-)-methyltransferase
VGKNKLFKWAELLTFNNTFQDSEGLKGTWSSNIFKDVKPITLELGCGKGEYTVNLAKKYPERNFIGVDIKGNRIWRGAKTLFEEKISNGRFVRTQIDHILDWFSEGEVDEIWITFPDPQPRKPHERKRLTSPMFLTRYKQILKKGGWVHLKTDNTQLYEYTLDICKEHHYIVDFNTDNVYKLQLPEDDILYIKTTYEAIFAAKGETIKYIRFKIN